MRITNDRSQAPAGPGCARVPGPENAFADTLTATLAATDTESDTTTSKHPPELSAATYRLFAAIDLERGDTRHAELHLNRVADAREAGLPLEPTGLLSDVGRWDYTEAAAALPQTGKFDTATGQGVRSFIPYNTHNADDGGTTDPCATETAATAPAANAAGARGDLARIAAPKYDDHAAARLRADVAALFDIERG